MSDWSNIVASYLDGLTAFNGETFIRGTEKPEGPGIPKRCVFVAQYGGRQPESMFSTGEQIHYVFVQCIIRSGSRDEQGGQTLANSIYDALRNAAPAGTMVIRPISPPIRLGLDGDSYRFSVNVTVVARE